MRQARTNRGPGFPRWEEAVNGQSPFGWNVRLGPIQFRSPIPTWAILLFMLVMLGCCCCGIPAFA